MFNPFKHHPNLTVQPGARTCKPFVLSVGVYSPEDGYKFELSVEMACAPDNSKIWKLLFDLDKKQENGTDFDRLINLSFTGGTPEEQAALETMANSGVSQEQARGLEGPAYNAVKAAATATDPSSVDPVAIHKAISSAITGQPSAAPVTLGV